MKTVINNTPLARRAEFIQEQRDNDIVEVKRIIGNARTWNYLRLLDFYDNLDGYGEGVLDRLYDTKWKFIPLTPEYEEFTGIASVTVSFGTPFQLVIEHTRDRGTTLEWSSQDCMVSYCGWHLESSEDRCPREPHRRLNVHPINRNLTQPNKAGN